MDERLVEEYDSVPTGRGVNISIVVRNPFGFFYAKQDKGNLPDYLMNAFTNIRDCRKAIDKYVDGLKPLRAGENKKPPELKLKGTRKPKQNAKASSV